MTEVALSAGRSGRWGCFPQPYGHPAPTFSHRAQTSVQPARRLMGDKDTDFALDKRASGLGPPQHVARPSGISCPRPLLTGRRGKRPVASSGRSPPSPPTSSPWA